MGWLVQGSGDWAFLILKHFAHMRIHTQRFPLALVILFLKVFTTGHTFLHMLKHFTLLSPTNLSTGLRYRSCIPTPASEGGPGQWSVSIFGISLGSGAWAAGNLENLMISSEDLLWAAKAAASRWESGGA